MNYPTANKNNGHPAAKAILAVGMWGTMSTSSKLLMNELDAFYVLFFSCLFATVILLFCGILNGSLSSLKTLPPEEALRMILIGSLGVFFYNVFYFLGTKELPAQTAFIINDLWPALIIVFSAVILKERLTPGKIAAVLLSFAGILTVVTKGKLSGFRLESPKGVLCCLGAALTYSLYSVFNKKESYDKTVAVLLSYASGTVAAFLCALSLGTLRTPTVRELLGMAYNGVFCNGLPYLLWALAMDSGNTSVIANLAYLTPVVSLFVTHYLLGEEITLYSVLGILLILAGIAIQIFESRRPREGGAA